MDVSAPIAWVHEAAISLEEATDPAAVGAAVTTALCGAAEHNGPCRWPHNNAIDPSGDVAVFRTLFIALEFEEPEVRARIQSALRSSDQWLVRFNRARPLQFDERALATQLARTLQEASAPASASLAGEWGSSAAMTLAGVPVHDEDVLDLARLLHDAGFDDTAEVLVVALEAEQAVVALSIADREAIFRALDDPPDRLAELRGVLLQEHEWRRREGLV